MKVLVGPNTLGLERCLDELRCAYPDVSFAHCSQRERLADEIVDAEIFMGWLTREIYLAAKRLKWIQSPSSGVNFFLDIPELVEGDVILTSARGTHGACLADHTYAMILAFTRHIREYVLAQQQRHWAKEFRDGMVELTGSTIGIVGLGAVGRAVAKRAVAFDQKVLAVDLLPVEQPPEVAELRGLDGLHDLLAQSDYVVVTVPYTSRTVKMIGAEELARMKPSALLVGISRGGIIDEEALVAALQDGQIAGAALDVCAQEPLPPESPLWDAPNLLITPHVAGGTQFEYDHILEIFRENLGRYLRGERPLRNEVDKQRGF